MATGLCVNESLAAAAKLEEEGVHAQVINIHTIKPIDADLIAEAAKKTGKIVTVEEHSVIGGLGSAVCDVLCEREPVKVLKIGMNDVYGESGPAVKLLEKYGLDADIVNATISDMNFQVKINDDDIEDFQKHQTGCSLERKAQVTAKDIVNTTFANSDAVAENWEIKINETI